MVAYAKPQQRKKEEGERLRGEQEIRSSLLILDLSQPLSFKPSVLPSKARLSRNVNMLE